jgi:heavy metal sensor kinase
MPSGRFSGILSTLRFRLMAWVTLVVFLIVVVSMVAVRQVVGTRLLAEFDQRLLEDEREVRQILTSEGLDSKALKNLAEMAEVQSYRDWFLQIQDASGKVLWRSAPAPEIQVHFPFVHHTFTDFSTLRMVQGDWRPQNQPALFLSLAVSRAGVDDDIALVDSIMMFAGVFILVLAPVTGFLLAGRATRPLSWIIATTARLQPAKLDERLPVRGSGDELDRLSRTINGMLDRIATYIDRHRDFIASAAHELRSPLAAIRSSVEVALNRTRSAEEYGNLLADVVEECTRLSGLVDRLLLLAESDAGTLVVGNQQAHLDKVVRQSVDMFHAVAETLGVGLTVQEPVPAVLVRGDEHHLRQVVRNLVDNALKFTPAGGAVRVELLRDETRGQGVLRVVDNGPGIDPADVPKIFDRFFRADKARQRGEERGGVGLGLSICHAIVQALGGAITVDSRPGQGCTFTATFPLAPVEKKGPSPDAP